MKKYFFVILILAIFFLTGCFDAKDIDDLAYALALGIDKGDEENFKFTFQIAAPLNIKSGVEPSEVSESGKSPLVNNTVLAKDVFDAVNKIDDIIAKDLKLTQLKAIIISDEIINSDIRPLKKLFSNERMFRDNIYVAGCIGKAYECLKHTKSVFELNPSKYYELLFSDKASARTVSTHLKEFIENNSFALPCFKQSDFGIKPDGTFIINNKKSVFLLSEKQTFAYNLLDGKITTAYFENALVSVKGKPKISTDFKNKSCTVKLNIISQEEGGASQKKNIKRNIENAGEEILEIFKTLKCDPLNIKDSQKIYFLTNKSFKKNSVPLDKLSDIKLKINYILTNKEF